jgi:hypothetical protein
MDDLPSWPQLLALALLFGLIWNGWPTFLTIHKHYHNKTDDE